MTFPTNADRADLAESAVETFARSSGQDRDLREPGSFDVVVSDLISDLFHLCNRNNEDFVSVLRHGLGHFAYEVAAEAHPDEDGQIDWVADAEGEQASDRALALIDQIAPELQALGQPTSEDQT